MGFEVFTAGLHAFLAARSRAEANGRELVLIGVTHWINR